VVIFPHNAAIIIRMEDGCGMFLRNVGYNFTRLHGVTMKTVILFVVIEVGT